MEKNKYDYEIICSIDIGINGAISFFDSVSNELLSIYDMPIKKVTNKSGKEKNVVDLDRLFFIMEIPKIHNDGVLVIYEAVHAFPGQGVVAVGTLLEQKGIIRGLAKGLGYDELAISSKEWQKYFGIVPPKELKGNTVSKTKALRKKWLKNESVETAKVKFPEWVEKIKHDGISDSLLIGKFFLESINENSP